MPFVDLLTGEAWAFVLVMFRTAGLVVAAPILGARNVPARLRLALGSAIALAAFLGASVPAREVPASFSALIAAALVETVIGLAAGVAAKMVLEAAIAAGQIAGLGTGLGYGSLMNPWSGEASTAPGEVLSMLALGLGVAGGLHREAIRWLARSLVVTPPGSAADLPAIAQGVISQGVISAGLAIRLSFPVLAMVLVAQASLGLLGRSATQLNLGSLTFGVSILAGGGALYLVAPSVAEAAVRASMAVFARG